ncbi:type II secretion system minor pseudopilin GspK [Ramlibacter sp. MMS24-I3-19]|uniref:type II secretion system minor pseudopilin GspK n=1 Tax=Ramlibacter sp. MMS24-I3-19 TaxID=3416606 RepID=UPI003CFE27B5
MRRAERGAALLVAMLIVTLVATFAAAALWQQWRTVEVEAAERSRMQAGWVLTGALDWSRLIIREDSRTGGADHLAEPWAVPLQEARLSTFLAADRNADTSGAADDTFLSGSITDAQGLLNLANLVEGGSLSRTGMRSFQRLFALLGLPQSQLQQLAENMRLANDISTDNQSASQAPLMPQRADQMAWLGVSPATVTALLPYVTILPIGRTAINLNTAPAEVIYAAVDGLTLAEAQEMVARRAQAPFRTRQEATQLMPQHTAALNEGTVDVATRFFEVRGRLRIDRMVIEERSLLQRDGLDVKTVWRERGVVDPSSVAQAQAQGNR